MRTILLATFPHFISAALVLSTLCLHQDVVQAQCPGLASITLDVVAAPVPTIIGNAQFCQGGTTTLTVPESFNTYAWSSGGNGQSINVNAPGTYTVTVTNATGCSGTASQVVIQSPAPTPNITAAPYQCNGQLTLNAGAGFSSYNWSNGANSQTTTVSTPGNISVTVTNATGCTGTDNFTVVIPPPPVVNIAGNLTFCTGTSTVLSATSGFAQYVWTGGSNGPNLTVNTPGTYNVTATDASGCTDVASATVQILSFTPPTISGGGVLCPGSTLTLTANGSNYTGYNWSGGQTSQSIAVSTPGVFSVTVTAANGCTGAASVTVPPSSSTATSITGNTVICNGGTTTLTATGSFQSYNWSNGAGGPAINVNQTGPYTVTVTNADGCTGTATTTVVQGTPPNVSISGPTGICPGSTINLSALPGGLVSYIWSNGANGQSINVNAAATYVVTATDANGCTDTGTLTVSAAAAPVPTIVGPAEICDGTSGTLSVAGSYSGYNWSTGQSTPTISVSNPDNYTVTVTAANGCTGTDNFNFTVNPNPTPNITAAPYTCNGQLTLNAGAGFVSYNWSNSGSTQFITVNSSGNFSITVTDVNGCTGTDNFTATIPAPPNVNITGNNQICQGETATLFATSGFQNYFWSNGQNDDFIEVTQAGLYEVTATDIFGCTATDAITLSVQPVPNPVISGPTSICIGSTATFTVAGGFSNYNWSNGGTGPSIIVSAAGTYSVVVTAANGCTGSDDITLTLSNSLQPQIVEQPYQCNGQIILDAGAGFTTYDWSTSGTSQVITVNSGGSYSVTVTDASGCTGTDVFLANIPAPPVVDITGNNSICPGETTMLSATPGFDYLWSNGGNGQTISVNAAGSYSVVATDILGCTATDVFTVFLLPVPQVAIAGPTTICTGYAATFDASGNFTDYLWSTGETTPSITTGVAGFYSVVVTSANGCTGTDNITLNVANGLTPSITVQPYTCNGQFILDAGPGFASYNWANGATTQTIVANTTDNYTVVVTDATGCTGTDIVAVVIPPAPQVVISGNTIFCQNSNTTLEATAGFASYLWSNGENTQTVTVSNSGNFSVIVTDDIGCTDEESITVTGQPLPVPDINGPAAICNGATATFSVPGSFSQISWSNGTNGTSINVDTAGSYAVTVTDAIGCTGTDAAQLVVNPNPVAQIATLPYQCDGQISLDAGAGFVSYSWSNSGNSQLVTVNNSGNYAVTVTNANGCTATTNLNVAVPVLNQISISGPLQFCQGNSTTLTGSSGFTTYIWSNGANTETITTGAVGDFSVTATDALGCTSVAQTTVSNFPQPTPVISGPQAVCPGNSATFSVPGAFTAYLWSNGATTNSVNVQPPASLVVTVTDANGCTGTASASVVVSNQLSPNIVQQPYLCDGQITLDAGAGFAVYNWSNSENTQTITVSNSGSYIVTVSDGGGCSGTAAIQVDIPVAPTLAVNGPTQICLGQSATLTADAGFLTYSWSSGQSGPVISVTQTATYEVTATDNNGCTVSASFVLGLAPPLTPIIDGATTVCTGGSSIFSVQGNYTNFNWSTGANTPSITASLPGNYVVTVTDVDGCTGTAAIDLNVVNTLSPNIAQLPYACNALITLDAGTGFATYLWDNGQTTQTVDVAQSGTYSVTVMDAAGCSGTATVSATIPANPVVTVNAPSAICTGGTATLMATTGFDQYSWSNGQTTATITVNQGGNFTVTATDANGCTALASAALNLLLPDTTLLQSITCNPNQVGTDVQMLNTSLGCDSVVITQTILGTALSATAAVASDFNGFDISCAGSNDGAASATPLAGQAPFTFQWSNGETTSFAQNLAAGAYSVTVTDAAGCSGIAAVSLAAPPQVTPVLAAANPTCQSAGAISVDNVTGGFGPYTIRLVQDIGVTNGQEPLEFNSLGSGTFTIEVTDANGCLAEETIVLLPPVAVQEFVGDTIEIEKGDTVTLNPSITITPLDINWTASSGQLSCDNCLTPSLAPVLTTTVQLDVQGFGECAASGLYFIIVADDAQVFIPNVIAPESTGNFSFTVYGDDRVVRVRSLQIYDRWGGQMALLQDFAPNDPAQGWDGTYRGKAVQPGVYVYWAEVEYADGSTEVFSGDVTVMR